MFYIKKLFRFIVILFLNSLILIVPIGQKTFASNIKTSKKSTRAFQKEIVHGTVVNQNGEPLQGVTIKVKQENATTTTSANGTFTIGIEGKTAVLIVSMVGYTTEEIIVSANSNIEIILKQQSTNLDEVVVVGYGTQKRKDLTGAVTSVSSEDIQKTAISSIDQGLRGRAAGVQVTQQTGQPGGATSIRIRGGNSINSANEPLYVIDGFPYYSDNKASSAGIINGAPTLNAMATINPGDIASIEILKDASATAIYGSRGANGVILITTNRGRSGIGKVDIDASYGVQKVAKLIPVINAHEYALFRNESFVYPLGGDGKAKPTYSDKEVDSLGEGTNWQKEIFRVAPIQNFQVRFSGGSENMQYMISANVLNQEGIVINSGIKRYAIRSNVDAHIGKKMKVGNSFSVSYMMANLARSGGGNSGTIGVQSFNAGNIIEDALFYNPAIPVKNANGNFTMDNNTDTKGSGGGNQANIAYGNPVALATLSTQKSLTTRLMENLYAEYNILKALKLKVSVGADMIFNKENSYLPSTVFIGSSAPNGMAQIGTVNSISWLNENTLNYKRKINDHDIDILGGFTIQHYNSEGLSAKARDFATDLNEFNNIGAANVFDPPGSSYEQWALASYLFRANYSYLSKYLFTFTARADGSSKFGPNNKFGFFPSAAFAWQLGEEKLIQSLNIFNDLKLRLGAGITGNQEIPSNRALSVLGTVRFPFDNQTPAVGFVPARLGNPDIKWETTKQIDVGIDMSFFSGRLSITADLYYKKTDDLLLAVRLPLSSGFTTAFRNIGSVQNKGVELAIRSNNVNGAFEWNTNFNIAFNRNKVLNFGDEQIRYIGDEYNLFKGQSVSMIKVGDPLGNFVGWIDDGIIKNEEELQKAPKSGFDYIGSRRFVDLNNDGVIDAKDRTVIGNALPDFTGGIQNSFAYKNFSLDALFQYSYGNDVYNMTQLELEFLNGRQNQSKTVLNRYFPGVNENTNIPRTGAIPYIDVRKSHSRWIEDGSFLRLSNLTLAYTVLIKKTKWIRMAKVYINGQNLWILSNYRGYDPEVNINPQSNTLLGFDYASYPSAKVFSVGLNLGL